MFLNTGTCICATVSHFDGPLGFISRLGDVHAVATVVAWNDSRNIGKEMRPQVCDANVRIKVEFRDGPSYPGRFQKAYGRRFR